MFKMQQSYVLAAAYLPVVILAACKPTTSSSLRLGTPTVLSSTQSSIGAATGPEVGTSTAASQIVANEPSSINAAVQVDAPLSVTLGEARVTLPAGLLGAAAQLTLTTTTDTVPANVKTLSFAYHLQLTVGNEPVAPGTLAKPITVTLTIPKAAVASTVSVVVIPVGATTTGNLLFQDVDLTVTPGSDQTTITLSSSLLANATFQVVDRATLAKTSGYTLHMAPPLPPTALTAAMTSSSSVTLHWNSGGGTTAGFTIAYAQSTTPPTDCISSGTIIASQTLATNTTYVLTGLSADTPYSFALCSVNGATPQALSGAVTVTQRTRLAPPPDPIGLTVHRDATNALTVAWNSGGGTTSGYTLAYQYGAIPPTDCADGSVVTAAQIGASTTYQVTGLRAYGRYSFRICALNGEVAPDLSPGATVTGKTLAAYMWVLYAITPSVNGAARIRIADGALMQTVSESGAVLSGVGIGTELIGLTTVPGGFIVLGNAASPPYSIELTNAGTLVSTTPPLAAGAWSHANQGFDSSTDGSLFFSPQDDTNTVSVYKASDGSYVGNFGSGYLNGPYRAVQMANGHVVVSQFGSGSNTDTVPEFAPGPNNTFTFVRNLATGLSNPFEIDYCEAGDKVLIPEYSSGIVRSCSSTGACTVINANTGLPYHRGIRAVDGAADCSFYLSGGVADGKANLYHGDGTLASTAAIDVGASAFIYQISYEQE